MEATIPSKLPVREGHGEFSSMIPAEARPNPDAIRHFSNDDLARWVQGTGELGRQPFIDLKLRSVRELQELRNALDPHDGPAGGYAVGGEEIIDNLEQGLLDTSGMRRTADVIRRDTGIAVGYPTTNDTAHEAVIIKPGVAAGQTGTLDFGQVKLWDYKWTTPIYLVPSELVRDSQVLAKSMGTIMGQVLGRGQNNKFTNGRGGSEPHGMLKAASVGLTAAASGAITIDELWNLVGTVNPEHRDPLKAAWMMHADTALAIMKAKDGASRYLWEDSGLDQWPIVYNHHMPTPATGVRSVLFGNFSQYKIRDIGDVRIIIYREQFVAPNDQIGFQALMSSDGALVDPAANAVKALVHP